MRSSIVLIANPTARRASEKKIERAADLFRSSGHTVDVFLTGKRGDAEEIARKASGDGASLIVAAGGDGTINEVVNGIAYTDTPLAILPMGTTNVLAKELGIPEDIEGAVSAATRGKAKTVSLGKILCGSPPSPVMRYFCLMAGIGFDGDAVYHFNASVKRHSGKVAYILAGLKTLLDYSPEPLIFSFDRETCRGYSAIIGKASKYGGNFRITPRANLLNPELYIYVMQGKRRSDILRYVLGVLTGRHLGFRDVIYRKAVSVKVEGTAHIQMDGDYLGKSPATVTVAPDALKLVY